MSGSRLKNRWLLFDVLVPDADTAKLAVLFWVPAIDELGAYLAYLGAIHAIHAMPCSVSPSQAVSLVVVAVQCPCALMCDGIAQALGPKTMRTSSASSLRRRW